jgi:hypothetical protein
MGGLRGFSPVTHPPKCRIRVSHKTAVRARVQYMIILLPIHRDDKKTFEVSVTSKVCFITML